MKLKQIAQCIAMIGIAAPALAQQAEEPKLQKVEITGSSIKRIQTEGALPVQVISRAEIDRQGISSAEQMIASINSNGTGADNLASNADVVTGAARGNNGASSANLRGQGADSTLILLNGRRVAVHGMKGQAVDLNGIPFAAIQRVEVLKDGASAIYGTDAIGGVINFITRTNYSGAEASAFTDVTEAGGGNIARATLLAGGGDLEKDGHNLMFTVSRSENKALRGDQRDFVNTYQPNRGLAIDTAGTPYATVVPASQGRNIIAQNTTGIPLPGGTQNYSRFNVLDLPGGAGCASIPGQSPYEEVLWEAASAKYACAWDTGRAAVLQQPVDSTNLMARGTFKLGESTTAFVEAVGSKVNVTKSFSPNQISAGATFGPASWYPSTGAAYNEVFNAIAKTFPAIEANRGAPIAYRWRCMDCGNREIATETTAGRIQFGIDGTLGNWDYKAGVGQAFSESESRLGKGYHYQNALIAALGSGLINPFLKPGEKQTDAGMALLNAASAEGVVLYGGKYTTRTADFAISGEAFKMPTSGMPAMVAVGTDLRSEEYSFNGDARDASARPVIFNAPFDDANALKQVSRSVTAYYGELLLPVMKSLDVTLAVRRDQYTGFGKTTNPKVSFRFQPIEEVLFRGSYNTGFRVPAFNQLFNGVTISPYSGKDLVDPATCASLKVDATVPGCSAIVPSVWTGGKTTLGPEESKQSSLGFVVQPTRSFNFSVDYWQVEKTNAIRTLSLATLVSNYALFQENFIRDASGAITAVDTRWVNTGGQKTRGVELSVGGNGKIWNGSWNAGLDGSRILEKKSKLLETSPWGPNEAGRWLDFTSDLGLKWKHTAFVTYKQGNWSTTLTQVYRAGYTDQILPGIKNGKYTAPDWKEKVDAYQIFHITATYTGFKNLTLTGGIKNLFDKDPPFSVAYDSNSGAGSSWEPRVADPRGRSFTLLANYKFM